jgi:hypothetical protein
LLHRPRSLRGAWLLVEAEGPRLCCGALPRRAPRGPPRRPVRSGDDVIKTIAAGPGRQSSPDPRPPRDLARGRLIARSRSPSASPPASGHSRALSGARERCPSGGRVPGAGGRQRPSRHRRQARGAPLPGAAPLARAASLGPRWVLSWTSCRARVATCGRRESRAPWSGSATRSSRPSRRVRGDKAHRIHHRHVIWLVDAVRQVRIAVPPATPFRSLPRAKRCRGAVSLGPE